VTLLLALALPVVATVLPALFMGFNKALQVLDTAATRSGNLGELFARRAIMSCSLH
jgi:hypothetical protein